MDMPKTGEFAHIGKSVVIKGELSGSEDLYVDGRVEGTIQLQGNNLVIGPHGHVHADVSAKGVMVHGNLEGNIRASERAELRKSAVIVGDIVTQRIAIEDGAYIKGKVDIQVEATKPNSTSNPTERPGEVKGTSAPVASGAAAAASSALPSGKGSLAPVGPGTPVTKQ